ncbi:hypothetical protein D3H65_01610 [Paraflavitalea soli]|uniref:Uncharacterized protein n=2 Tax=Paraflavitalea soli TaxID=2315862 RepID=A0A3B7MMB1_9BACT|nr:hypothetical protein D3H65_01610 [Paraflavitalea soli]
MAIFTIAASFFMPSCSKQDVKPGSAQEKQTSPVKPKKDNAASLRGGGEDDGTPIVMHKVKTQANAPIPQARVFMVNDTQTDTLEADTDSLGEVKLTLPAKGSWLTVVTRQGYHPKYFVSNFVDSFTIKTSILQEP